MGEVSSLVTASGETLCGERCCCGIHPSPPQVGASRVQLLQMLKDKGSNVVFAKPKPVRAHDGGNGARVPGVTLRKASSSYSVDRQGRGNSVSPLTPRPDTGGGSYLHSSSTKLATPQSSIKRAKSTQNVSKVCFPTSCVGVGPPYPNRPMRIK